MLAKPAGSYIMTTHTRESNTMKDKVTKLLIKWGNKESDVIKMVEANFDLAVRAYPQATARKIADFCRTLR